MSLLTGYSRKTVAENIANEINRGYPRKQAVAMALKSAREAWRAEFGGKQLPKHLLGIAEREENPVKNAKRKTKKRVGTSQTKKSMLTHKMPSKRLKKRRASNVKEGYYPNPSDKRPARYVAVAKGMGVYFVILHGTTDTIMEINDDIEEVTEKAMAYARKNRVPVKVITTSGKAEYVKP